MYTHLTEQLASQHQAELHARSAQAGRARRAHQSDQAHQTRQALRPQGRTATGHRQHRHPVRRRAGYALVSLGLRLAYLADED